MAPDISTVMTKLVISHRFFAETRPFGRRWLLGVKSLSLFACVSLSACDQLGIETPQKIAERQAAEAKAVGSACRHASRAIEDCYTLNPKADKSAVFAGWREMDEYMRENKLEGVAPVVPRSAVQAASAAASRDDEEEEEIIEDDPPRGAKRTKSKEH